MNKLIKARVPEDLHEKLKKLSLYYQFNGNQEMTISHLIHLSCEHYINTVIKNKELELNDDDID
jgi:hypothetical protein